jgi:hypothetical protein
MLPRREFPVIMGAVVFSDVHADAAALESLVSCIADPAFRDWFGPVDFLVNLGDLLHRGYEPEKTLRVFMAAREKYPVYSVLGNHDYAFLHSLPVSGNDMRSAKIHAELRGSTLLSLFDGMPDEWRCGDMLFVHGGPLDRGGSWLEGKEWQRLARHYGMELSGLHYTPEMAFEYLEDHDLRHLCCGHRHERACCRKRATGIISCDLTLAPPDRWKSLTTRLNVAGVPLDDPAIIRLGGCHGARPQFGYTDFSRFWFIELDVPAGEP